MKPIDFNNHVVSTDYGLFLENLRDMTTVWVALSTGQPLINSIDFVNFVDTNKTLDSVIDLINATDLNGNFDSSVASQYDELFNVYNNSRVALDIVRNSTNFLPYCMSVNSAATYPVQLSIDTFTQYLDFSFNTASQIDSAVMKSSADTQTATANAMVYESKRFYWNTFQTALWAAIATFLNTVQSLTYIAQPVYYNYVNSGNFMCSLIRSPLNGTWAAAGMIGLFWIPASICLWFTSSYLYKVHKRKPTLVEQQPVQSQPVVVQSQPIVVPPQSRTIVTPVVASAPLMAVESPIIAAPAVVPVVTSTAPSLYPVITDDSLAIIEGL